MGSHVVHITPTNSANYDDSKKNWEENGTNDQYENNKDCKTFYFDAFPPPTTQKLKIGV